MFSISRRSRPTPCSVPTAMRLRDHLFELSRVGVLLKPHDLPVTESKEVRKLSLCMFTVLLIGTAVISMTNSRISCVKHFLWSNSKAFPFRAYAHKDSL